MNCDDFLSDLVARHLGELDGRAQHALSEHLAVCAECGAAAPGYGLVLDGSRALDEPVPDTATIGAVCAAVAHDERVGALLTSMALDQLDGGELAEARALVESSSELRLEFDAIARLVAGSRSLAAPLPSPRALARLKEAVRDAALEVDAAGRRSDEVDETASTEDPRLSAPSPVRRNGRSSGVLRFVIPLAAAAALIVAAVILPGEAARTALVIEGKLLIRPASGSASEDWADPGKGAVHFGVGDELQALDGPVELRVRCDGRDADSSTVGERPSDAVVDFELGPGARLSRTRQREFELTAGGVKVHAGRFGATAETRFVLRHGRSAVLVEGTQFDASAVDGRLGVVVHEGRVLLSVTPESGPGASEGLSAGERGLADGVRIVRGDAGDGRGIEGFLTPRIALDVAESKLHANDALRLTVELSVGAGGPVRIVPFEDSIPLFAIRLKGPAGEKTVKLQGVMLRSETEPDSATDRGRLLEVGRPYRLEFEIPRPELEPGTWAVSVLYTSYRAHSRGREWLGVVESASSSVEVTE